jgi:alpha-beta hydrolase superfamily lysophospholipase
MSALLRFTAATSKHLIRIAWGSLLTLAGLGLAIALGFTLYAVTALPPLQPWHRELLGSEFSALRHGSIDFDGYLNLEEQLFSELRAKAATWEHDEAYLQSRFNPGGALQRLAAEAPYNRSFRLTPAQPRGAALLIHGLTDSPYSMKALAESLQSRGIAVTVLRLPGHGTLPSMMTEMSYRDWHAAMRIAAADVAKRAPSGGPFYIGGYSTGATLALLYAIESLRGPALRRPDRVLLISPAIELTRVAALANIIDVASVVPIPVLEKVRWQEVLPEYDPYKFNSFPVNASRQVNRATRELQSELAHESESGRIAQMPSVVAWQSVVDSTVGATGTVDVLFAKLRGPQHQLVLFDVNRSETFESVQRPAARELIERSVREQRAYTLHVVTNINRSDDSVVVHRLAPDGTLREQPTNLKWPRDLVSLGHVALPFPPDDPVYGFKPGSGRDGIPSIGSWLLRGESGALTLSLGALTRLRSNPFWAVIDSQVGELVAADLAGRP